MWGGDDGIEGSIVTECHFFIDRMHVQGHELVHVKHVDGICGVHGHGARALETCCSTDNVCTKKCRHRRRARARIEVGSTRYVCARVWSSCTWKMSTACFMCTNCVIDTKKYRKCVFAHMVCVVGRNVVVEPGMATKIVCASTKMSIIVVNVTIIIVFRHVTCAREICRQKFLARPRILVRLERI